MFLHTHNMRIRNSSDNIIIIPLRVSFHVLCSNTYSRLTILAVGHLQLSPDKTVQYCSIIFCELTAACGCASPRGVCDNMCLPVNHMYVENFESNFTAEARTYKHERAYFFWFFRSAFPSYGFYFAAQINNVDFESFLEQILL